uniref:Uncharacterized protein n=1 Tax=Romanomermis culicivorax TaxID=13658 RepID=A0A915IU11_ROMCU
MVRVSITSKQICSQAGPVHYLQANGTFIFVYSTNQAIVEPTVIVLSSRPHSRSVIAVPAITSHLVKFFVESMTFVTLSTMVGMRITQKRFKYVSKMTHMLLILKQKLL